jgi:hypothetical protein
LTIGAIEIGLAFSRIRSDACRIAQLACARGMVPSRRR